jgi:hypothetical protein
VEFAPDKKRAARGVVCIRIDVDPTWMAGVARFFAPTSTHFVRGCTQKFAATQEMLVTDDFRNYP